MSDIFEIENMMANGIILFTKQCSIERNIQLQKSVTQFVVVAYLYDNIVVHTVLTAAGLDWLQLRDFCGFAWRQLQRQSSNDRKTCHSCLTRFVPGRGVCHTSAVQLVTDVRRNRWAVMAKITYLTKCPVDIDIVPGALQQPDWQAVLLYLDRSRASSEAWHS